MAGRPKGIPKTGGRKKGTPNKVTAVMKDAIAAAIDEVGGVDYLVGVANSDPKTSCTLLGKLVPSEVRADLDSSSGPLIRIKNFTGIEWEEDDGDE